MDTVFAMLLVITSCEEISGKLEFIFTLCSRRSRWRTTQVMMKWVKSLLNQKGCVSNGSPAASLHTVVAGWQQEVIR